MAKHDGWTVKELRRPQSFLHVFVFAERRTGVIQNFETLMGKGEWRKYRRKGWLKIVKVERVVGGVMAEEKEKKYCPLKYSLKHGLEYCSKEKCVWWIKGTVRGWCVVRDIASRLEELSTKGERMTEEKKKKTLGNTIFMDTQGLADLLDQANKLRRKKTPWYNCNICGEIYMETELIDDEDIGYICDACAKSKKELDDEQEEIETTMREEKKSKALP